jgi:NAD(P)-dependent dehydrogenase (short-subunit alcohol dehydrogenase family)
MRDTRRRDELDRAAKAADVVADVRQLDVRDEDQVRTVFHDMEQVNDIFETNFFGAARCAQAVLPITRTQNAGAIVNVASVGGRIGAPIQGPYCATKFAMVCLTLSLAVEARPFGIRVAAVLPTFIATPDPGPALERVRARRLEPVRRPLRRWAALYEQARCWHRTRMKLRSPSSERRRRTPTRSRSSAPAGWRSSTASSD